MSHIFLLMFFANKKTHTFMDRTPHKIAYKTAAEKKDVTIRENVLVGSHKLMVKCSAK